MEPDVMEPDPEPLLAPIEGVFVSDPLTTTLIGGDSYGAAAVSHAWVSLRPGTVSDGVDITVSNRRNGASFTAAVEDGGLDPVAIPAAPGDTLDLSIATNVGASVRSTEVVRPSRPPIIVRTSPPPRKRDVPLNERIVVVFSEPMDSASLFGGTVQLKLDGALVPGALAFSSPERLAIEFTPASNLEPGRAYTVVVTPGARDESGQPLDEGWTAGFVTTAVIPPPTQLTSIRVGDMIVPRGGHTATLLMDGRVLITGGTSNDGSAAGTATAELYDPATRTFVQTGSMREGRTVHRAVLLLDGTVLVVGGHQRPVRAELYDPATGTFRETGSLQVQQYIQSATLLHDGEVLVVGADGAELYEPATGSFRMAGSFAFPFSSYEAARLPDGRVLLAGDLQSQIYDPSSNTFRGGGSTGRYDVELQTLTVLQDGRVLMAGGSNMARLDWAVVYDPLTDSFAPTGSMHFARDWHEAVVLSDGRVMVAGGEGWECHTTPSSSGCVFSGSLASIEIYDPYTGRFELAGDMQFPRSTFRATRLQNGDVLITGGHNYCGIGCYLGTQAKAELLQPAALHRRQHPQR